ncbi:hypothetical protein HA050_14415 [Iodobacter sp. HSC-16F04]|uniref:Uncharacterized protein n=1 Tax=Iodobacter violaceini TaxID=3044271 RepID=A0ABX0KXU7_9NEIS|nr:hypothetical protein [Iodobacter violacea]NHQ87307.1 hypothetical protein [Iodobacter violacea]
MTPIKNQLRGRPCATPVERLRARFWYYSVKARTSLSDYQLDLFFLEKLGRRPEDPQKRTRIFETIRLNGTLPSNGKHPKRDFDLIKLVDEEDAFAGTAEIFHSPYWQLLTRDDADIAVYNQIAQKMLKRLGLTRLDSDGEFGFHCQAYTDVKKSGLTISVDETNSPFALYEKILNTVIKESPTSLDQLAALGALFREAYLACALEIALIIKHLYCDLLDEYVQQKWLMPIANPLQELGEGYLIFPHSYNYMYKATVPQPYDDEPLAVVERIIWYEKEAKEVSNLGAELRAARKR